MCIIIIKHEFVLILTNYYKLSFFIKILIIFFIKNIINYKTKYE